MSNKSTPKSCSCTQCKFAKKYSGVKKIMKTEERAHRHSSKIELNKRIEDSDITPSFCGKRYG